MGSLSESLLVTASELSLLHLLHLVVLAEDGASFLCFELCDLDLAFVVHVFASLLNTVVSLLYEREWLWHVLEMLHECLKLSLLLVDLFYGLVSLGDIRGLLGKTGQLCLFVFLELGCTVFGLTQILLQLCQLLSRRARAQL